MRERLNGNPVVQAVFIGLLAIVVAFMLFTRVLSGSDDEAATAATPATSSAAEATAVAPSTDPASAGTAPEPSVGALAADGFKAGPGLPKAVVDAYDDGKVVALLIIREHPQGCFASPQTQCGGIDDRRIEPMVRALGASPDVEVFVTHAINIARYSRITLGVDVDRTPALVVLRPKRLTEGPLPAATVQYGVRSATSIDQAVRDALYAGRDDLPYYPE